jgi:UDP-N-acetylglucosamine--N-acetylmuramyl-(pentapeptide) pyrophosphoryl-undecaprenol N-acetylglucosamine transferase
MKIVLTGGGSGGHFYPLIAVANELTKLAFESKLVEPDFYYLSHDPVNTKFLNEANIKYFWVPTGKMRLYFSIKNYIDMFKLFFGIFIAIFRLLIIYPDIIFSKGGYDSLPTCIAAWILRIPIISHDSDSIPGRASLFVSKFADRIAVSYKESIQHYKNVDKLAFTSQPILEKYLPSIDYSRQYNDKRKTILITGGSQGSVKINDTILQILPELVSKYNIIHQCGPSNYTDILLRSDLIMLNYNKKNYELYPSLDFSNIYPKIDLVISRAGSSMFEYIEWELPAIVIPISPSVSRDQSSNASCMEQKGNIKVIQENNFTPGLALNIIDTLLQDKDKYMNMVNTIKYNKNRDASRIISEEILKMIQAHA